MTNLSSARHCIAISEAAFGRGGIAVLDAVHSCCLVAITDEKVTYTLPTDG